MKKKDKIKTFIQIHFILINIKNSRKENYNILNILKRSMYLIWKSNNYCIEDCL